MCTELGDDEHWLPSLEEEATMHDDWTTEIDRQAALGLDWLNENEPGWTDSDAHYNPADYEKHVSHETLRFTFNGTAYVATSDGGLRLYWIRNEGIGLSDRFALRVNGVWMPYRISLQGCMDLADAIERENRATE